MKIAPLLAAILSLLATGVRARTVVPTLAHVAGLRVGVDTTEGIEQRHGRGSPMLGGHPRSGRMWRCDGAECTLYLDGFNHDSRGEHVIDTVLIEPSSGDEEVPLIKLPASQLRFLGVVRLGMHRPDVLRATGTRLPAPQIRGENLVWEAKGERAFNHGRYKVRLWRVELRFRSDTLQAIFLEAV